MADERPSRGPRPRRRLAPRFETLGLRELMSAGGLGTHLGRFVAPGTASSPLRLQGLRPALPIDVHRAINRQLAGTLGPGIDRIQREAELNNTSDRTSLATIVSEQPSFYTILNKNDTYTLLDSPGVRGLITPRDLLANSQGDVTLTLPISRLTVLVDSASVEVRPGDPAPGFDTTFSRGFFANVPLSAIVSNPNDTFTVRIPSEQIPPEALIATSGTDLGRFYRSIGPLMTELFRSGVTGGTPTAVPTVPGLRLPDILKRGQAQLNGGRGRFSQILHIAAEGRLFQNLTAEQQGRIDEELDTFLGVVDNWGTTAPAEFDRLVASKPAGQLVPTPIPGPLNGTLAVTLGAIRPAVDDLPGRIDVGFILSRNGDYGIILSARGPLSTNLGTPSPSPSVVVAGDVQVEASNADDFGQLEGWRVVEGITQGSLLSGALASTNDGQVATFAASTGYGGGLEYGLGVRFTQIIPLGNALASPFSRR